MTEIRASCLADSVHLHQTAAGNLGIGTLTPTSGYKVDVVGSMLATGVKGSTSVTVGNWIFGSNTVSSAPHTTFRTTVANGATRMYFMPNGTPVSGVVASTLKVFGSDYYADNFNYHEIAIQAFADYVNINTKGQGTHLPAKDIVFTAQDVTELMRIYAQGQGVLFGTDGSILIAPNGRIYANAGTNDKLILNAKGNDALWLNYDSGSGGVAFYNGAMGLVAGCTSAGAFTATSFGGKLIPTRTSQAAQPTPDSGEVRVWHDTDDGKTYLVYTDPTVGARKVEMT